jgi:hypothetical protein
MWQHLDKPLHQLLQHTLWQLHTQFDNCPQCVGNCLGLGLWQHLSEVLQQLLHHIL